MPDVTAVYGRFSDSMRFFFFESFHFIQFDKNPFEEKPFCSNGFHMELDILFNWIYIHPYQC